ncbi:MAG: YdeI/OmpD-associated family protein [Saprospiraceae bacterium]|nr:YdeI/OmpD-associated family protein [Saprospiraceae bacterium]
MTQLNPKVDLFIADGCGRCDYYATDKCKVRSWQMELQHLRQIMLETGLVEDVKWGVPVYTHQDKKYCYRISSKRLCYIWIFKGVLLIDPKKIVEQQGPSVQSARIIRFTAVDQIINLTDTVKEYVKEAVVIEESGVKVEFKKDLEPIPDELNDMFEDLPALRDAFYALTPGKQRGYIIHFSQPKQSASRISRIEKCIDKIMNGEGFHDAYKKKAM